MSNLSLQITNITLDKKAVSNIQGQLNKIKGLSPTIDTVKLGNVSAAMQKQINKLPPPKATIAIQFSKSEISKSFKQITDDLMATDAGGALQSISNIKGLLDKLAPLAKKVGRGKTLSSPKRNMPTPYIAW